MHVTFYENNSPTNYVNKNLLEVNTEYGETQIKDSTDLSNPILEMLGIIPTAVNYAYVDTWKRYYFIENTQMTRYGTTQINMHCDVLMSFKEAIKANSAMIISNPNIAHPFIEQRALSYVKPIVITKEFQYSFNETATNFVMAVIGG